MIRHSRLFSVRRALVEMAVSSAVLLLCGPNAFSQASRVAASLEGTVSDSSRAVIPQATIALRNTLTTQSRAVRTDDQGFFRADQLAVGTYEVRLEHPGFAPYHHAGVVLNLGQTIHLEIVLSPVSASEEVTVAAQPYALDMSQTSVVSSVDQDRRVAGKEPQLPGLCSSGTRCFEISHAICRERFNAADGYRLQLRRRPQHSGGSVLRDGNRARLRLIFGREGKLLVHLQDFLRCMFPEETLHIRRKFEQKIANRIRAQGTTKAIHGVPEVSVMSWVVGVL